MRLVKQLWAGDIPLGRAFWRYAVVYGLLVNLVTTGLFFAVLLSGANVLVAVVTFALPIPYNVFMVVAVWRSATRYPGPASRAELARIAVAIWMIALSAV